MFHRIDCSKGEDEVVPVADEEEVKSDEIPVTQSLVLSHPVVEEEEEVLARGGVMMKERRDMDDGLTKEVIRGIKELKRAVMDLVSADEDGGSALTWSDILKMAVYVILVVVMSFLNYLFSKRIMKKTRASVHSLIQDNFPAIELQHQ